MRRSPLRVAGVGAILALFSCSLMLCSCVPYLKMNPPPDTDKAFLAGNNSCYLATAANMLAGAGYGNGTTVQDRANDVYGNLTAQFGTANTGWIDAALSWWLTSQHNVWPNNPYTVVTVYGNKNPKYPWSNANGARDIANYLRQCNLVGLSISWPTDAAGYIGWGGHAITGWGDGRYFFLSSYRDSRTSNPGRVEITDSDNDNPDVHEYVYDAYTNPNPGGANEGTGWYIDYDPNHPYIKHIVTLSPVTTGGGSPVMQKVVGSYRIQQTNSTAATDLHYRVGTDVDILSYETHLSWLPPPPPAIVEDQPRRNLRVDWNLSELPVPAGIWVTITTEFILRSWNAMYYDSVQFTYPGNKFGVLFPAVGWEIRSARVDRAEKIPNVTGGYVVAAFNVADTTRPSTRQVVGEYRLLHQYSYSESPEEHTLLIKGIPGTVVTDLRFGHSYGMLTTDELWKFTEWMTDLRGSRVPLEKSPKEIRIDWRGKLPYPEGEDIKGRIPDLNEGLKLKLGPR